MVRAYRSWNAKDGSNYGTVPCFHFCEAPELKSLTDHVQAARDKIRSLIDRLHDDGLTSDEIRRAFEAEFLHSGETTKKR